MIEDHTYSTRNNNENQSSSAGWLKYNIMVKKAKKLSLNTACTSIKVQFKSTDILGQDKNVKCT